MQYYLKEIKMRAPAIFAFVLLFLFMFSCKDEQVVATADKLYGKWEATDFFSMESVSYPKKDGYNPKITFFDSGVYGIDLDYNFCGGHFTITNQNSIEIESPVCTKLWTDSEFSVKFSEMVSEVSDFTFEENGNLRLNVNGWGYILLEKAAE